MSAHLLENFKISTPSTTPLGAYPDPWRLLRNSSSPSNSRQIRLIVHGGVNGAIDPIFYSLADEASIDRKYPVQIEALTSLVSPDPLSHSLWLVPLLLLPGHHVCRDLPAIRNRLKSQGKKATLLPFLGSWSGWLSNLKSLVEDKSLLGSPVLLHHPLENLVGHRYLTFLSKTLNVPVIPWSTWGEFQTGARGVLHSPIPCSLLRNRQTDAIMKKQGYSSLLEIESFRKGLIDLLRQLP